jgi:hypothetical protein
MDRTDQGLAGNAGQTLYDPGFGGSSTPPKVEFRSDLQRNGVWLGAVVCLMAMAVGCDSGRGNPGAAHITISTTSSGTSSSRSSSTWGNPDSGSSNLDSGSDNPDSGSVDATVPDSASVDASADDVVDAASADASEGGALEDAFTFPDAQSLSGLRIGILGDTGVYAETMLDAYLATAATVTRIQDSADAGTALDPPTLAAFDVVILDRLTRAYTQAEAQALADWVAAGHGVLSLAGYANAAPDGMRPSSLLAVVGLGYDTSSLLASGTPAAVSPLIPHPLMEGVANLDFFGGWAVVTPSSDGGPDAGSAVVVARVDATHAALVARDYGAGRAAAWGDEWISYDSQFQANQGTQRFWNNAILWLTHRN